MALSQKQKEDLLKFAGIAIGAVAAWKILFAKKKAKTVAAEVIETPVQVVKKAADVTKKTISETVGTVEKVYKKTEKKAKKVAKTIKKDVKKVLPMDDNKDGKVDAKELDKRGKAATDANIIKANKLDKKAAQTVKDGMVYPKGAKKGSPEMKAWMQYLRERRSK